MSENSLIRPELQSEIDAARAGSPPPEQVANDAVNQIAPIVQAGPLAQPTTDTQDSNARADVVDPNGSVVTLPHHQLSDALKSGYRMATPEDIAQDDKEKYYGNTSGMAASFLQGAAQTATAGLSTGAQRALGDKPEDIRGVEEVNPISHTAGEIAGLFIPGAPAVKVLEGLGKGASLAAKALLGESMAARIGATAVKGAVENAAFASGNEVSKMLASDPGQSADTVRANIGMGALLGSLVGGGLGVGGEAYKALKGTKLGSLAADFKQRLDYHVNNPDPAAAVTDELTNYHKTTTGAADEVYGPQGLKAQDVAKAVPELSQPMYDQAQGIAGKVSDQVKKMINSPESYPVRLVQKLQGDLNGFMTKITEPNVSSADMFNATQDLKQSLQGYSKFDKFVKPVDEAYDFVRDSKSLASDLRQSLEDTDVWGKAADRQKAINKAFVEYLPALKDFERKFTSAVGDERVVDPAKVNTYLNQLGKPNAELKQEMLKNFIDSSDKYRKVIADTHANLGISSPLEEASLNSTKATLGTVTPGAKLADFFVKKGAASLLGKGIGAITGAAAGHGTGIGSGIGALIGEHAVGPFVEGVLPYLAKGIQATVPSAEGMQSAIDYGVTAARGEQHLDSAVKKMFKAGAAAGSTMAAVKDSTIKTLDKNLQRLQADNSDMTKLGGPLGHYMPEHSEALAQSTMKAVDYLNSVRPGDKHPGILDKPMPPTQAEKSQYNRVLAVASQPSIVLDHIKQGTLTLSDIRTVQNVYPDLYKRMSQKLMEGAVDARSKGQDIPYKTRMGLSLFLGQPMDSSMTPASIMAAQPKPQQAQPQTATQPASNPKRSTNSLNKLPASFQTPGQASESRRVNGK